MNRVILSGNLTRDPEVRYTQSGKQYARGGIAVKRPFNKDAVDFFNFVAWEKTAEFFGKYFTKGSRVLIEGRLQTGSYKNQQGVDVATLDVIVENVEFAGGSRADTSQPQQHAAPPQRNNAPPTQRQQQPPPKNDYFEGEPVDPNDTPF